MNLYLCVKTQSISRSIADQRRGRCGRTMNGKCIRMYSRAAYQAMERASHDCCSVCGSVNSSCLMIRTFRAPCKPSRLKGQSFDCYQYTMPSLWQQTFSSPSCSQAQPPPFDPHQFPFFEPPAPDDIDQAIEQLDRIGAVRQNDQLQLETTSFGDFLGDVGLDEIEVQGQTLTSLCLCRQKPYGFL